MKINRIKLKDWGPHASLDEEVGERVVGIIGGNGKGKSNLLQAVSYALTGELGADKGTDYIRNYGQEGGATVASVEILFSKDGKDGRIMRTIPAKGPAKRVLEWDGKSYTRAADVDAKMQDLLGCDRNAVRNAVYIRQGEIDKLVRGTPAERKDTFLKLLNLYGVEKRAEMVKKRMFALKTGLRDFTADRERIAAARKASTDDLKAAADEVAELEGSVEMSSLYSRLVLLLAIRKRLSGACSKARADYEAAKSAHATALSAADPGNRLQEVRRLIADDTAALASMDAYKDAYYAREKFEADKKAACDAYEAALVAASTSGGGESLHALEQEFADADARMKAVLRGAELEGKLAEADTNLRRLGEMTVTDNSVMVERARVALAAAERDLHIASLCADTGRCPVCGGPLENCNLPDRADAEARVRVAEAAYNAAVAADNAARVEAERKRAALLRLEEEIKSIKDEMAALPVQEKSYAAVRGNCVLARAKASSTLEAARSAWAVVDAAAAKKRAYADMQPPVCPPDPGGDLPAVRARLEGLKAEEESLVQQVMDLNAKEVAEAEASRHLKAVNAEWEANEKLVDALADEAPDWLMPARVEEAEEAAEGWARNARTQEAARARVQEAEKALSRIAAEEAALKTEEEAERRKLDLIADLQKVADITGANGVPLAYAGEIFKAVTPLVQSMLERMQANFTVSPDPERPLTYRFVRTDGQEGYPMAQERLSGGQAIRLAVALLVAAQRTILPDVGLLIMDEPSSHVDTDGVEHMRDLFANMSSVLENADMQLIVVDHNPVLAGAFNKVVKL